MLLADLKLKALDLGVFPDPEPPEDDKPGRTRWRNQRNQAWSRGVSEAESKRLLRIENGFVWALESEGMSDDAR